MSSNKESRKNNLKKDCIHPAVGISITDSSGSLRPCCRFHKIETIPTIFDVASLDNIHNTPPYKIILDELDTGKFPSGCQRCSIAERTNIISKRQESKNLFKNIKIKEGYVQDLEIALDFTCNMMCRTCNPGASSKWGAADSVIKSFLVNNINLDKNLPYKDYQDKFYSIFKNTDLRYLSHIKIQGGEPFYSKNLKWFLNKLSNEVIDKQALVLSIFTNGSVFPDNEVIQLLKDLNATIVFSIDAYGKLAECIRWGIQWDQIEHNIKKFKEAGFECCTNTTISILNVNKLNDLQKFCKDVEIEINYSELLNPNYLSIYQLPNDVRLAFLSKDRYFNKILMADIDVDLEFSTLEKSIEILDKYQNIKFSDCNPEMYNIIRKML